MLHMVTLCLEFHLTSRDQARGAPSRAALRSAGPGPIPETGPGTGTPTAPLSWDVPCALGRRQGRGFPGEADPSFWGLWAPPGPWQKQMYTAHMLSFTHLWLASLGQMGFHSDAVLLFSGSSVILCFSKGNGLGISKNEHKKKKIQGEMNRYCSLRKDL